MTLGLESFEGLTAGTNIADVGSGFLRPGTTGVFQFASGVQLLDPIPNVAPGDAVVGDFSLSPDATWGVTIGGSDGDVLSSLVVPHGTAYIGRNVEEDGTLTFGFDQPVFRVGALVNAGSKVSVAAYDAGGNLVGGGRINPVAADDWGDNILLVSSKKPIAKVVYTGDFVILDNLAFETDKSQVGGIKGTNGNDRMNPGNGGSSDINDTIYAKKGNDKVLADAGSDVVDGGGGNDKLHGGLGNDNLTGGLGKDKLWGEDGQDTFLFTSRDAIDTIKDFDVTQDSIILEQKAFPTLALGTLDDSQFDATASTPDVRIIYEAATGRLLFDGDGSGGAQAVQFAKITPNLMLSADLFFVA